MKKTIPDAKDTIRKGLDFLTGLQGEDGSWRGEYAGPQFLLPMYVAACHIAGRSIEDPAKSSMIQFLKHYQNPDGSLGLHEESSGCMFTTALGYAALRILGLDEQDPQASAMRKWMHENGTALGAASWGKFTLAMLNLYSYEGLHPITPEMWLLPYSVPFHPGRFWCHSRMVYLPMSWLYGKRAQAPADGLVKKLRYELYGVDYEDIDFSKHKNTVCPCDNIYPLSPFYKTASKLLGAYEHHADSRLRQRALDEVYEQISFEDQATHFIDIGPVNSVLNTMVHHFADPGGPMEEKSFAALERYLVNSPEGIKFNGYNNTALWDTAFASQAILSTPFASEFKHSLQSAFEYIDKNQVLEDVQGPERHYRHRSKGGWPFSDVEHGWPITDCTAEGFKAAHGLSPWVSQPMGSSRLRMAIELILSMQNGDGGWASYEKKRGGDWLEHLNPSQVFSAIMVDHSYVECSSACMQALSKARGMFGEELDKRVKRSMSKAESFVRTMQRADGSWYGSWAVCFTYGTWFATTALLASGAQRNDPALRNACGFLIAHQNPDGGWGEHFSSCTEQRWVRSKSTAVQTAWALSSLVRCGLANTAAAKRGANYLIRHQQQDGDWPEEALVGVFNKTTLIDYENYRRYFPIWALAEWDRELSDLKASSLE